MSVPGAVVAIYSGQVEHEKYCSPRGYVRIRVRVWWVFQGEYSKTRERECLAVKVTKNASWPPPLLLLLLLMHLFGRHLASNGRRWMLAHRRFRENVVAYSSLLVGRLLRMKALWVVIIGARGAVDFHPGVMHCSVRGV